MARAGKTELGNYPVWPSEWRKPDATAAYVVAVDDAMGSSDFFRQGGVEFPS